MINFVRQITVCRYLFIDHINVEMHEKFPSLLLLICKKKTATVSADRINDRSPAINALFFS